MEHCETTVGYCETIVKATGRSTVKTATLGTGYCETEDYIEH